MRHFPFFSQTNFPGLWTIFQYFIGGTVDKRKLCKTYYDNQENILEVGCSTGNIARAFIENKNVKYTGIDLDKGAIKYAKYSFKNNVNFKFLNIDLRNFKKKTKEKFDYILFAGIIHHIDSVMAIKLLKVASKLLSRNGALVVVDPLLPDNRDSKFVHYYMKFEQGNYLREEKNMLALMKKVYELKLEEASTLYVNATPLNFPVCAKFGLYKFKKLV